jgi:hypothetical protein
MVETRVSLRGSQSDKISGADLNLFVTTFFWRGAPLIGDDYARATLGTQLRWDMLALFHWIKTEFGRKTGVEVWPGIGGSHEDQAINGVLYLLQPEVASQFLDELPCSETDLQRLAAILGRWETYKEDLIDLRTKPAPIAVPEAPKPQEPAPVEAPKPDEPEVEANPGMAQWKKTALKIAAVLASAGVVVKLLTPSYIDIIWDAVVGILRAIGSM